LRCHYAISLLILRHYAATYAIDIIDDAFAIDATLRYAIDIDTPLMLR
jgi:hypothetical protein